MEKRLVTLMGGDADGEILAVHPAQVRLVVPHERERKSYAAGEWATEDGPPVVTRLVDFEAYERVDAETFKVIA